MQAAVVPAVNSSWQVKDVPQPQPGPRSWMIVFAFPLLGRFCLCFGYCQAAARWLAIVSALVPMAQMKPNSSRATAVVIFLLSLPAAPSFK